MSNLNQEIKDLEIEYKLQEKHLKADGVLDDNDKQQLQAMKSSINQVKAQLKKQEKAAKAEEAVQPENKKAAENKSDKISETNESSEEPEEFSKIEMDDGRDKASLTADENGKVTLGVEGDLGNDYSAVMEVDTDGNYKVGGKKKLNDKTSIGVVYDSEGKITGSVEHEVSDKTKGGLEISTDGSFKATAEHEFDSGVVASAEITNEKIKLALGKKWETKELGTSGYLIPPGAIAGLPIALKIGVNCKASASISATEEINIKEGVSKIGIKATGSGTGALRVYAEAGGIVNMGGEGAITASVQGSGQICWNGSSVYPEASITGSLVVKGSLFIGLSDPIINAWMELGGKRSDLEFKYPLVSLELYTFTGLKIVKGEIVGKPAFNDGKDLKKVKASLKSAAQKIASTYNSAKDKINEIMNETTEYWGEKGFVDGMSEAAKHTGDFLGDKWDEWTED
jgi:hypothetical protein